MKAISIFVSLMVTLSALTGCARIEKVSAIEGTKEIPYQSLGTLEVKQKAYTATPTSAFWTGVEVTTLTLANTPSRSNLYKNSLRTKLARLARKKYGADAVINVQYWPDPESKSFPQGYLYARGEMIRYEHFPGTELPIPSKPSNPATT